MPLQIKCLDKFGPLITKEKRVKIAIGGRASTKTTFIADHTLSSIMDGNIWCCAREFQNSIDESVHRTLCDEIDRLSLPGFTQNATSITHASGGRPFYRGLARNITSIKGMLSGVKGLWIEEGETLSENTLRVLTASLRNSAKDFDDMMKLGIDIADIKMPEIWISMNRGSRADPIAKKWLARAESVLARGDYYEDDTVLIVQANYTDMPRKWFLGSGLEQERVDDEQNMTPAQYRHKWHGDYLETVENAIIQPEWFDACIDAHITLGFEPLGQERVAYDPSDAGGDPAAIGYQHGSVVLDVQEIEGQNVTDKTESAIKYTLPYKPDAFTWDCDGLGAGLTFQLGQGIGGKKIKIEQFKGSFGADKPNSIYMPVGSQDMGKQKTNKETFYNWRSQFYTSLADKMLKTYLAVKKGKKIYNVDELISFSSSIKDINKLKSEICRIPLKPGGRIQILSKPEMKALGIDSPNMADVVMMLQREIEVVPVYEEIPYEGWR
jgi:phage terminase large subunit